MNNTSVANATKVTRSASKKHTNSCTTGGHMTIHLLTHMVILHPMAMGHHRLAMDHHRLDMGHHHPAMGHHPMAIHPRMIVHPMAIHHPMAMVIHHPAMDHPPMDHHMDIHHQEMGMWKWEFGTHGKSSLTMVI